MCLARSVALLSPHLSEAAKAEPFWRSWVAHVRLLEMSLHHEFWIHDTAKLDGLVKAHHRAFLKVSLCYTGATHVLHTVLHTVLHGM